MSTVRKSAVKLMGQPGRIPDHERTGTDVEVKIGIADTNREITVKTEMSREDVESRVQAALSGAEPQVLELDDEKGKRVLVAGRSITYVEIGEADKRPVGFLGS